MKKVFNSFFVIIAAMVTFAGCAKQEIDAPATPETKTVQFFANSIETKTAFGTPDGNTYPTLWSTGDKVKVFVNLNTVTGVKTEDVVSVNPSDDLKEATFKSTEIGDSGIQDYTFYAVCPSDAYQPNSRNSETSTFTVMIPQTQKPTDDSVDSNAQVIYAVSENYLQPQMPTNVDLDFQHFSAYCKLSFSGLSVELGNIAQVTLESEVDLAGKWHVNVGEGEPTVADGSKKIIITTDKSENIWIACAPADVRGKTIKFIIDAMDGSSVSREVIFPNDDKYQFRSSRIANLTIDMTEGVLVKPTVDKCFEKVTSAPSDWTGTYLIVYEGGKVAFDGSLATLDAAGNTRSVTITNNKIVYTETLMKSTFAISKNGDSYSIKSASGKYIGNNSDSNSLTSSNSALNNSLTFISAEEIDVISKGGAHLRYNATSGQNRFRYFKSGTYAGQKAIQLYKLVGDESEGGEGGETPEPELQERNLQFSVTITTATLGEEFVEPTLSGAAAGVIYSSSNTNVATVNENTGEVTLVAAGETTITASAASDETYKEGEASYTLTVSAGSQGGDTPKTWKLVTDASTLAAGDKLAIVSSSKGQVAGSLTSQYLTPIAMTITGNAFPTLPNNAVEFTLGGASGAWTLADSDGKLLGATAVKKLAWGSGTTKWSISIAANGDATIQNGTSTYGRFLYNVSSPRFTTYTSNASASMLLPQIYRYE